MTIKGRVDSWRKEAFKVLELARDAEGAARQEALKAANTLRKRGFLEFESIVRAPRIPSG